MSARSCRDLSDLLGEIHDLSELAAVLEASRAPSRKKYRVLLELIDRRRQELQREAFELGGRIFAEKPSVFLGRIETYWEFWRSESAVKQTRKGQEKPQDSRP